MNTLNTPAPRAASGVTRRNARNEEQCPRCHRLSTLAPDSIVCERCAGARPSITTTVTVTVTLAAAEGER
jgi:hypothetical protein